MARWTVRATVYHTSAINLVAINGILSQLLVDSKTTENAATMNCNQ